MDTNHPRAQGVSVLHFAKDKMEERDRLRGDRGGRPTKRRTLQCDR
uniref:Uncharacterized protein n=1 Tax=Anguilla anguilla TaxID=7936 RepID=A0A0E9TB14_ANGAN